MRKIHNYVANIASCPILFCMLAIAIIMILMPIISPEKPVLRLEEKVGVSVFVDDRTTPMVREMQISVLAPLGAELRGLTVRYADTRSSITFSNPELVRVNEDWYIITLKSAKLRHLGGNQEFSLKIEWEGGQPLLIQKQTPALLFVGRTKLE